MMTWSKPLVLLVLTLVAGPLASQVFQKTYGGTLMNDGAAAAPTDDGGVAVAGRVVLTPTQAGVVLVKLDVSGVLQWSRIYDVDGKAYAVRQTRDGGYILAGEVPVGLGVPQDVLLVRTDPLGNPLWSATYGTAANHEYAFDVIETADGGFAFAGAVYSAGSYNQRDAYVVRTDAGGNVVWSRTYGGAGYHGAGALLQTRDGGLLVVGGANTGVGGLDEALVIKTDAAGASVWLNTYGGLERDWAVAALESASGYLIAVDTRSFGGGNAHPGLIALDSLGNVLWGRTYASPTEALAISMIRTTDGDVVIAGASFDLTYRGLALRTDAMGVLRRSKYYGRSDDWLVFLAAAAGVDGGSWLVGEGRSGDEQRIVVVKTNEHGTAGCRELDAGFVTNSVAWNVSSGPGTAPGPGLLSLGSIGMSGPTLNTETLCFCEGARALPYGSGWPGTSGIPALVSLERPVLGRTTALHASNSLGAMTAGLLLLGRQPIDVGTPFDGRLLVQFELGLGVTVGTNGTRVPVTIPNDRTLCGVSVFAQVLQLDAGATKGVSFTPGLELQFGL